MILPCARLVDSEFTHLNLLAALECQVVIHDPLPKHSGRQAAGRIDGGEDAHFLRNSVRVCSAEQVDRHANIHTTFMQIWKESIDAWGARIKGTIRIINMIHECAHLLPAAL
jgi:hypothetical protein